MLFPTITSAGNFIGSSQGGAAFVSQIVFCILFI